MYSGDEASTVLSAPRPSHLLIHLIFFVGQQQRLGAHQSPVCHIYHVNEYRLKSDVKSFVVTYSASPIPPRVFTTLPTVMTRAAQVDSAKDTNRSASYMPRKKRR